MRSVTPGHAVFAATLIAIGILGLIEGDFPPVWEPVPRELPLRAVLAHLCALVSLASGLGLLWTGTAGIAARVLFAFLLAWWLLLRVPRLFLAPGVEDSWSGCGETAVMVAAAAVLHVGYEGRWYAGGRALRIAQMLYGLALLPFGAAHFIYLDQTAALVPGWLPAPVVWACLTGVAFLAAGVAVLSGRLAPLATLLSALQMGAFTLLVWVPIVAAGSRDAFQWSETVLSWALTAGAWVVAESYRPAPNRRRSP